MTIPIELTIWNAQQCAKYLGVSYSQFIKRTQWIDGFPKRLQIPGHPRWNAKQVIDWAHAGTITEAA